MVVLTNLQQSDSAVVSIQHREMIFANVDAFLAFGQVPEMAEHNAADGVVFVFIERCRLA